MMETLGTGNMEPEEPRYFHPICRSRPELRVLTDSNIWEGVLPHVKDLSGAEAEDALTRKYYQKMPWHWVYRLHFQDEWCFIEDKKDNLRQWLRALGFTADRH